MENMRGSYGGAAWGKRKKQRDERNAVQLQRREKRRKSRRRGERREKEKQRQRGRKTAGGGQGWTAAASVTQYTVHRAAASV